MGRRKEEIKERQKEEEVLILHFEIEARKRKKKEAATHGRERGKKGSRGKKKKKKRFLPSSGREEEGKRGGEEKRPRLLRSIVLIREERRGMKDLRKKKKENPCFQDIDKAKKGKRGEGKKKRVERLQTPFESSARSKREREKATNRRKGEKKGGESLCLPLRSFRTPF